MVVFYREQLKLKLLFLALFLLLFFSFAINIGANSLPEKVANNYSDSAGDLTDEDEDFSDDEEIETDSNSYADSDNFSEAESEHFQNDLDDEDLDENYCSDQNPKPKGLEIKKVIKPVADCGKVVKQRIGVASKKISKGVSVSSNECKYSVRRLRIKYQSLDPRQKTAVVSFLVLGALATTAVVTTAVSILKSYFTNKVKPNGPVVPNPPVDNVKNDLFDKATLTQENIGDDNWLIWNKDVNTRKLIEVVNRFNKNDHHDLFNLAVNICCWVWDVKNWDEASLVKDSLLSEIIEFFDELNKGDHSQLKGAVNKLLDRLAKDDSGLFRFFKQPGLLTGRLNLGRIHKPNDDWKKVNASWRSKQICRTADCDHSTCGNCPVYLTKADVNKLSNEQKEQQMQIFIGLLQNLQNQP